MFALGEIGGVGFPLYTIPPLHLRGKTIGASIHLLIEGLFFDPQTEAIKDILKTKPSKKHLMSSKKGSLVYETECQQAFFCCWCCVYKKGAFQKSFFCCCRGDLVTMQTYFVIVFIFAFTHSQRGQFKGYDLYTHISKSISKPRRPNLNEDLAFFRSQKTDRPLKEILMSFLLLHM